MWTNDQQMPPPCLKHSMDFGFSKCISFHVFARWLDRLGHMLILLTCIQKVPSSILGSDPNYTILKYLVTFLSPPVTWWDNAANLAKPLPSTPLTIPYLLTIWWGHTVALWLRHYATNRQVASSIPDGVIGIFHWRNPSGRTMALGSTQPLTEMSTRCISWG